LVKMKLIFEKLDERLKAKFRNCKFLVLDFDGVLTDNYVFVDSRGNELVCCSRFDSLGLSMLKRAGVKIAVLSKEKNPVVRARAKKLNIECFQGIDDKAEFLINRIKSQKNKLADVCYVGNDLNDLGVFAEVGLSVAVGDADKRLKQKANYVTKLNGGQGAVREICEFILFAKKIHPHP